MFQWIFTNLFQSVQLRLFANLASLFKTQKKWNNILFFQETVKEFQTVFHWFDSKLCTCVCLQSNKRNSRPQNVTSSQRNHNVTVFRYSDFKFGITSVLNLHCIGLRQFNRLRVSDIDKPIEFVSWLALIDAVHITIKQGRNQLFISGRAVFMKFHSMTSSCLFNRGTTFFANGHI